jgi:hypothetical protein
MKRATIHTLVLSVVCVLALASGCIFDGRWGDIVVTDKVSIKLDEYRTNGTLGSAAVAEEFANDVYKLLDKYDCKITAVKKINIVGATYEVVKPSNAHHDWTITSRVTVLRQDNPNGPVTDGPVGFVKLTKQSLHAAKRKPVPADLRCAGVELVDRALRDVVKGQKPRLVLGMEGGTIAPVPTPADPLSFTWRACVTFQVVLHKEKGHHGR